MSISEGAGMKRHVKEVLLRWVRLGDLVSGTSVIGFELEGTGMQKW